ncbi:MAG: methyltransferase [Epsilonproteobacteria bacterium (ex Lamellibrachia satsuma)]|nr:MAG: methyltransferase [Epsilonproteobacteria bacterium (ex Lamellibrachia satsuma)]
MKIQNEFSKNAKAYNNLKIIQKKVAEELICKISKEKPGSILDIGCGSGGILRSVHWPLKKFVGIDFAEGMIDLHPKEQNIELFVKDFNDPSCFKNLDTYTFDRIISASALQWADDLDHTFQYIAALNTPVTFAIFTSGTFKTLLETASIPPLLRSAQEVTELSKKYFKAEYEILTYTLEFPSVRDMFRYMKKSGVGGARNILGYKEMKNLMKNYPLNYLEYEILLIHEERIQ